MLEPDPEAKVRDEADAGVSFNDGGSRLAFSH